MIDVIDGRWEGEKEKALKLKEGLERRKGMGVM